MLRYIYIYIIFLFLVLGAFFYLGTLGNCLSCLYAWLSRPWDVIVEKKGSIREKRYTAIFAQLNVRAAKSDIENLSNFNLCERELFGCIWNLGFLRKSVYHCCNLPIL
jgi:hypothetical protein